MNVFTEPTIELVEMDYSDIVTASNDCPIDMCHGKDNSWEEF